jgi:hypothetical protein
MYVTLKRYADYLPNYDQSVFWHPRVDIYEIVLYFRLHYKIKQLA